MDIQVVDAEEFCPQFYEPDVIYSIWYGLDVNCYCWSDDSYTQGPCKESAGNECQTREPHAPVIQTALNGKKFCGRRRGNNFVNQNRVADFGAQGFSCQDGKVPCDERALEEANRERTEAEISEEGEISETLSAFSVEHIVCVDYITDCPITDIKVSNNETYADIMASGYEAIYTGNIDQGAETTVFISKQSKSLPVTGGRLSPFEPCLNPSEFPLSPSNYFDDEIQMRASECSESTFLESNRDMRYEKLDLPIKQEDLE